MGSSGSGKGYWLRELLLRHLRQSNFHNRRKIFYCSPELYLDKTLAPLRDSIRHADWFLGIDVGIKTGEASGLGPEEFYQQHVHDILVHVENGIICLDDIQDSYCPVQLRKLNNRLLRTGRHDGNSVFSIFHSIRNGQFTQQALQSCKHAVIFPKAQKGRIVEFMKMSLGLRLQEARELTKILSMSGRACVVRLHAPVSVWSSQFLRLL